MPDRIMVYLGAEEYEERKASLEALAAAVGAHGQRGPSVSVLIQAIADGELPILNMHDEDLHNLIKLAERCDDIDGMTFTEREALRELVANLNR